MLMKVFSKGQVVIPVEIRKNLGIEPGDLVSVTLDYSKRRIELKDVFLGSIAKFPDDFDVERRKTSESRDISL